MNTEQQEQKATSEKESNAVEVKSKSEKSLVDAMAAEREELVKAVKAFCEKYKTEGAKAALIVKNNSEEEDKCNGTICVCGTPAFAMESGLRLMKGATEMTCDCPECAGK